jgi:hypothetical protein
MQWLALWKSISFYRDDDSVWSNNYKDFIFCDDGLSHHSYAFLGVGRTPGSNDEGSLIRLESENYGGVLHFQFVSWDRFQLKQAWYRCSELINKPGSAQSINEIYKITLDDPYAKLAKLPANWIEDLILPKYLESSAVSLWHQDDIFNFFDKHGAEFFEGLQIWHIDLLRREFFKRLGRYPKLPKLNLPDNILVRFIRRIRKFINKR